MNKPTDLSKYSTIELITAGCALLQSILVRSGIGLDLTHIKNTIIKKNHKGQDCLYLEGELMIPLAELMEVREAVEKNFNHICQPEPTAKPFEQIFQEFEKHGLKPPKIVRVDGGAEKFIKFILDTLKDDSDATAEAAPEEDLKPVC